jgi:hypothetical protein
MRTKKINSLKEIKGRIPFIFKKDISFLIPLSKNKYFVIPRDKLEKIYLRDKTIISLIKNNMYHHEMLMALQQQIVCLEAKIKLLEARLK